jgi:hypothetical protein
MLPQNAGSTQYHRTAKPAVCASSQEVTTSETFSNSTLLAFFEKEINGSAHYASELIYLLEDKRIHLTGVNTTILIGKMQPFLKSKESREAALKIACYVAGNLMKS